jgi:hypothetical protein
MPSRISLHTISGHVLASNRRPISDASVSLDGKIVAHSGNDGYFSVDVGKPSTRVALTFAIDGFVSNTRVYNSMEGSGHLVVMWPIAYRVKFDPSRDLDVELGLSRIRIPANAIAGPDGNKPGGPVALQYTWFDVSSPLQRAAAPGDFSGQMRDRSVRRLNSFGIFDIAVLDSKGRALGLGRGASIDLSIPVPRKLAPKAPRQIGFFDFDTVSGYWIEAGHYDFSADTLHYNGTITRLPGVHNLDDPQDTTCVTVQVLNMWDSLPLPNMTVTAAGANYTSTGITNASGYVCLLVQRNASFSVNAYGGNYMTPSPATFTSPNFSSAASDCGDAVRCPLLGPVYADLIVGTGFRMMENEQA